MTIKLHTENIAGNLHQAASIINQWGWAEYVIGLDCPTGSTTIAVFKMPAAKVHEIRNSKPSYWADPHHDDYTGPADQYSSDYRLQQTLQLVQHVVEAEPTHVQAVAPVSPAATATAEVKPKTSKKKPPQQKVEAPPVEQQQSAEQQDNSGAYTQELTETFSEQQATGVDMNAADAAQKSNLPDWAQ